MKRLIYIILAFYTIIFTLNAEEIQSLNAINGRPKVAVVLAGGGAKGTAHLGVLKVIEECGIPIDMIVGTSMGSIVGGLYSIGYTSEEIINIVRETDWINLILDTPDFGNQLLTSKKDQESYLLRISLDRARVLSGTSRGGIIHGNNITAVFNKLTAGVPKDCSFNDFPIPFACVATDAITGKKHVFREGNIVTAMRSSMAMPTIFTPVKVNDMALVDGGIVDNYPVDIARDMGADIVIGVDLVNDLSDEELANSAMDVMSRILDMISETQYEKNKKDTDLYISVNTTGYSAASFSETAIDTLIVRGEDAGRKSLGELRDLARRFGISPSSGTVRHADHGRMAGVNYKQTVKDIRLDDLDFAEESEEKETLTKEAVKTAFQSGTLSLGARFDNQNYASLQLGIDVRLLRKKNIDLNIYGRLGAIMKGSVNIAHPFSNGGKIDVGYLIENKDMMYYYNGTRYLGYGNYHHQFDINYKQEWRRVSYSFGTQYDVDHYRNVVLHSDLAGALYNLPSERYFTYYVKAEYNSLNAIYYPSRGSQVEFKTELITSNLYKYKDSAKPFLIFSLYWRTSVPFNTRFNFIPHASTRVMPNKDAHIPMALSNFIGGLHRNMWSDHQIEIAGLRRMEINQYNNIAVAGFDIQQRLGKNHFLIATVDGASNFTFFEDAFLSETSFVGCNFGYHYRGLAGPISLVGMWSTHTKKFGLSLNIGYYF